MRGGEKLKIFLLMFFNAFKDCTLNMCMER